MIARKHLAGYLAWFRDKTGGVPIEEGTIVLVDWEALPSTTTARTRPAAPPRGHVPAPARSARYGQADTTRHIKGRHMTKRTRGQNACR